MWTKWTLLQLQENHFVLDAIEVAEQRARERAEAEAKRKR